jgi:hypothetical protein
MTTQDEHVTTATHVKAYEASNAIFHGLLKEVRELSKKKPEATMNAGKVKIINRVLSDLVVFLKDEPEGKYLDKLDDESLPQVSDAVLIMVQFETALENFQSRYWRSTSYNNGYWITEGRVAELEQEEQYEEEGEEGEEEWEQQTK